MSAPDMVTVVCRKPKCPRKAKVRRDETMPRGTAYVRLLCPWHESPGGFNEESYYDAGYKQLLPE